MMTSVDAYSPRSFVNPARIARVTSASDASPKMGMLTTRVTRAIPSRIHKGWQSRSMTNASRWKDANVKAGGKVAAAMHLGIAAAKDRISREAAAELVRFAHERFPEVAINGDVASARLDALVAIGEDRFLLDTLHRADARVPVLAVGAGFLAELPVQGLQDAIPKLVAGKHRVEERLRLAVTAGDVSAPPALNEAVLTTSRGGGVLRGFLPSDGGRGLGGGGGGGVINTPTRAPPHPPSP